MVVAKNISVIEQLKNNKKSQKLQFFNVTISNKAAILNRL